jgi:tetratricopeptide (TPR) repeat protein
MKKLIVLAALVFLVGCSQSLYTQGRKLADQGSYDRAIQLFYDHISAHPQSGAAWRELGVAFYRKADMAKAEDALMQANAIEPDARTNLYLGMIAERQQLYGEAIDAYLTALSLRPNKETRELVHEHLNGLKNAKMRQDVNRALAVETEIDVDTIPENTIAVIDFDNSNLPDDLAPISKGLAEFTALDLAKVQSLRVVDRAKIDIMLQELQLGASEYVAPGTAPRMGRLLGSNRIITGSVMGTGENYIQLDAAVINTRDSSTEFTGTVDGDLEQFFKVQKDFVFKIIGDLGVTLTAQERDAIEEVPTESYLAFMAYCRGLDFRSRGMYDAARQSFGDAAGQDKGFEAAAKQQQSMPPPPERAGTFQQFEASVGAASGTGEENLGDFQAGALGLQGFIPDPNRLDRFGNSPDSPIRTSDITGLGTITVQGNLDVQP